VLHAIALLVLGFNDKTGLERAVLARANRDSFEAVKQERSIASRGAGLQSPVFPFRLSQSFAKARVAALAGRS